MKQHKNQAVVLSTDAPMREKRIRKAAFTGRYQVSSGKGGFKRSSKDFIDPADPLKLLKPVLQKRKHDFLGKARENFKRKAMSDKITLEMKKRARKLKAHQHTSESKRMLDFPQLSLQTLGVERNHINANGQVATQLTAFASAFLNAPQKKRPQIQQHYQSFAESHGLDKQRAQTVASEFSAFASQIESQTHDSGRQRMAEKFLNHHTSAIADQSENLRFGRSQHQPKPDLKIVIPSNVTFGSNQDVGSHWDGNRTPNGSLTPRSQSIRDSLHSMEQHGIFPAGLANAATERPIRKSDNTAFGSLQQIGK